jgi:DNA adenine methylase
VLSAKKNTSLSVHGFMKGQLMVMENLTISVVPVKKSSIAEMNTREILTQTKLRPIVKISGGKHSLSSWILQHFPEDHSDLVYCEPFCGAASIYINKEASAEEILSDKDKGIICIFKALRDEPQEFINRIRRTKYTERTFQMALNRAERGLEDYVNYGINEYILRRMSRGGLKKNFVSSDKGSWKTMIKQLSLISKRLQNTSIHCADFTQIMKIWDEENTFFYLDPPLLEVNKSDNEQELSIENHLNMLHLAKNTRGKAIISSIYSSLYSRNLKGWKCRKRNVSGRVEAIWFNY